MRKFLPSILFLIFAIAPMFPAFQSPADAAPCTSDDACPGGVPCVGNRCVPPPTMAILDTNQIPIGVNSVPGIAGIDVPFNAPFNMPILAPTNAQRAAPFTDNLSYANPKPPIVHQRNEGAYRSDLQQTPTSSEHRNRRRSALP